jgi:oligopeptide transport system substrate-binding protein
MSQSEHPSRRRLLSGVAAGAAIGLLPGTAFAVTTGPDGEKILHRGNGSEPQTLDPHKSSGVPESWIQFDLFEGLLAVDGRNGRVPGAAESWTMNQDGSVYTFKLRPNGKWSDGTPVTAHDFVFAWRRICDPKTASNYAFNLWVIKNAQEASNGEKPVDQIGVKALDDLTLEVTLRGPTPYFTKMLIHHSYAPISKANYEKFGENWVKPGNMVSNGAYMLAESVPQGYVKVVKNPHFYDAAQVKIPTVIFYPTENLETELRRYRSGELHLTYDVPVSQTKWVKENLPKEYRAEPYLGIYFYAANLTKEPWKSNKDLRLALNLGIDRTIIVEKITGRGELPSFAYVPVGAEGYTPQVPDYGSWTQEQRETKAKELLAKHGYGPGGKKLELEVLYNTNENHRKIAIAVSAMWQQKLGVKVTLNNQEWKVYLSTRDEKAFKDVIRQGWIADYNDPITFLDLLRSDVTQQNPSGYANPAYDALLNEANRQLDPAKRTDLLQQAERMMLDDVALFPIYVYAKPQMVSTRVIGWEFDVLGNHPSRWLDITS